MSYFPARVPPACLFLLQSYRVFSPPFIFKRELFKTGLVFAIFKRFLLRTAGTTEEKRIRAQVTGIKEEDLSEYMKAAG